MPPEAFEGKTDARGDVYALGLTLYELLALRPAFDEKDRNRLIKQVTHGGAGRGWASSTAQVPRDLETIVHKAIDTDPARPLRDGRRAGRRPAAVPRRRADPGAAGRAAGAGLAVVPAATRRRGPGGGASCCSASPSPRLRWRSIGAGRAARRAAPGAGQTSQPRESR